MLSPTTTDRGPRRDGTTTTRWRRTALPVVLAVALVVGGGGALVALGAGPAGGSALVVADADTGERLLVVPVRNGTTVTLAYTHSVERTPVRDEYVVHGDQLVMTRMRFQSYGWGLPARADVETVDGWFVTRPDWRGRTLYVTPGRIAGHRLVVDGRSYDLVERSDAETVRLSVVRRSPLEALLATADRDPRPPGRTDDDTR